MAAQKRPIVDRRVASRVKVQLKSRFTYKRIEHEALVMNISFVSALFRSTFIPATGSDVTIKLESPLLEAPLIIEGTVVRYECSNEKQGTVDSFAVRFSRIDPDLAYLVNQLADLKMPLVKASS
jgi:hypothetical protein